MNFFLFTEGKWLILLGVAAALLGGCSSAVSSEELLRIKPTMKVQEVEALLGRPGRIEQSETLGLHGQVFHYACPNGDGQVTFLNDKVFKAEFVPEGKST